LIGVHVRPVIVTGVLHPILEFLDHSHV